MQPLRLLAFLLACCLLASCPHEPGGESASTAGETTGDATAAEQAGSKELLHAAAAGIKQLIIIYTGDTLSAVQPPSGFDPPQGGIPALGNAIAEYQRSIVYFNQLRVSEAGGDPSSIRADREGGMLGEHPYLLLDYGGWERPNDYAGAPLVGLYLTYLADFGYHAIGSTLFARLEPERWEAYRTVNPGVQLLASSGTARGEALPAVTEVVREVHGAPWCIVAVPLPRTEENDPSDLITQYVNEAWQRVQASGADYSVLLMPEGPPSLYRDLAEDGRFTVIIGAPARLAIEPGYGDLIKGRTLLLPNLNPSGRQFGVCHLQYDGGRPTRYNLMLNDCLEDEDQPYPYRQQAKDAWAAHEQLVEEHVSAAKIGNP